MRQKWRFGDVLNIIGPPVGYVLMTEVLGYAVMGIYMFSMFFPGGGLSALVTDTYQLSFLVTALAALIGIPILIRMRHRDAWTYPTPYRYEQVSPILYIFPFISGILLGSGLNQLVTLLGVDLVSESYEESAQVLFSMSVHAELVVLGIIVPITEELLFRGLVYGRLRYRLSPAISGVICALMFGIYHGNLSQGVYAFFVGLALCYMMERYHSIWAPILLHMGANIYSVIASETHLFDFSYATVNMFLATMVLALAFFVVVLWRITETVFPQKVLKDTQWHE